jgi:hypothetical protein
MSLEPSSAFLRTPAHRIGGLLPSTLKQNIPEFAQDLYACSTLFSRNSQNSEHPEYEAWHTTGGFVVPGNGIEMGQSHHTLPPTLQTPTPLERSLYPNDTRT